MNDWTMLDRNTLMGGCICISSDKLSGKLLVMVLKSDVSILG